MPYSWQGIRVSIAMRWLYLLAASAATLFAQLPAFNDAGVVPGHIHLMVQDPDAHMKLWKDLLGATETSSGSMKMMKLPGIFVIFFKGQPSGPANGSTVDHIGFSVKDMAAMKAKIDAAHIEMVQNMFAVLPDGVRLEFLEDKNQAEPVMFHHMHLFVSDAEGLRSWYVKMFGATPGSRRNGVVPSANFSQGEVDFLKSQQPTAPTKGRAIDHIGFDVKDLEATMKRLTAEGVQVEMPVRDMRQQIGLKIAFVMDPVGTRIELTEGLAGK